MRIRSCFLSGPLAWMGRGVAADILYRETELGTLGGSNDSFVLGRRPDGESTDSPQRKRWRCWFRTKGH